MLLTISEGSAPLQSGSLVASHVNSTFQLVDNFGQATAGGFPFSSENGPDDGGDSPDVPEYAFL